MRRLGGDSRADDAGGSGHWRDIPSDACRLFVRDGTRGSLPPEERLHAIDAALIATAKRSIDLASYALIDLIVLDALNDAEHHGVVIRIVLDPRERYDFVKLDDLSDNVRMKLRLHRRRPPRAPSRSPRSTIADGRRPAHFV